MVTLKKAKPLSSSGYDLYYVFKDDTNLRDYVIVKFFKTLNRTPYWIIWTDKLDYRVKELKLITTSSVHHAVHSKEEAVKFINKLVKYL